MVVFHSELYSLKLNGHKLALKGLIALIHWSKLGKVNVSTSTNIISKSFLVPGFKSGRYCERWGKSITKVALSVTLKGDEFWASPSSPHLRMSITLHSQRTSRGLSCHFYEDNTFGATYSPQGRKTYVSCYSYERLSYRVLGRTKSHPWFEFDWVFSLCIYKVPIIPLSQANLNSKVIPKRK